MARATLGLGVSSPESRPVNPWVGGTKAVDAAGCSQQSAWARFVFLWAFFGPKGQELPYEAMVKLHPTPFRLSRGEC